MLNKSHKLHISESMKNNLTTYIDLLKNAFDRKNTADAGLNEQAIRQETEKTSIDLTRTFYGIEDENKQRTFVRNVHSRLVRLSDHLYGTVQRNKTEPPPQSKALASAQQLILNTLQDLIDSIYKDYPALCNGNQKITAYSRPAVTGAIIENLEVLSLPATDPDHLLFEEVKTSVSRRFKEPVITYGLSGYLQAFIREIILVREYNLKPLLQVTLTDLLISFNFNSVSLISLFISSIRNEASKIETETDKITFFNCWLKKIHQLPVSSDSAFDTRRESARDYLDKWLDGEASFLEKNLMLHSGIPHGSGLPFSGDGSKFELNLSVQQIACLIWLFIECGVIKNGGKRDLSTFISEHFCSKKQENISPESLRVKSYSFDESTREKVRLLILTMLKRVSSPM